MAQESESDGHAVWLNAEQRQTKPLLTQPFTVQHNPNASYNQSNRQIYMYNAPLTQCYGRRTDNDGLR